MADLILHHYPFSTFSEKVRAVLGYKGLAYGSVEIVMHQSRIVQVVRTQKLKLDPPAD